MKWCSFPFPPMKTPGFGDVFVFLQPKPKEGVFVLQGYFVLRILLQSHTKASSRKSGVEHSESQDCESPSHQSKLGVNKQTIT